MKKLIPFAAVVIALVIVALYIAAYFDTGSTTRREQTDFAIKDTASVGKIFIADTYGNTILLERDNGPWMVNGRYKAREDAAKLLLETFRNIYVQRPVAKESQEQVNRIMAGSTKKVEIYDRDGKIIKTWYVGYGTMDKKGTYMLLETPDKGKSSAPFIMDMRGFTGMLDTRFFTNLSEWRSTVVMNYPTLGFREIEVSYPGQEASGFRIVYGGGNDIKLFAPGSDTPFVGYDTITVKDYLLNFKLASFENYNTLLTPAQEDSVKSLLPYQIIHLTDANGTRTFRFWSRPAPEGQMDMDGETQAVIDRERVYASVNNDELAFAQRFVWDKFRAPLGAFKPRY
jgi:hypothetical protein